MSDSATPWTVALQAPLSMKFFRQEHWSGLLFPPPESVPNPGTEPRSPTLQADSLPSEPPSVVATYSSILVWEISWTEEPGGLQFKGS